MAEQAKREVLLTRFFVFEASEGRRTWTYVGEQLARDREHAGRLFYEGREDAVAASTLDYCAVSENAWKPKRRSPKVVTTVKTDDVAMPALKAEEPAPVIHAAEAKPVQQGALA